MAFQAEEGEGKTFVSLRLKINLFPSKEKRQGYKEPAFFILVHDFYHRLLNNLV